MKIISLISAVSENYVIGAANKLVWHMPSDFEYYKSKIRRQPIIMGRKTSESEDMFFSEHQNILVTRDSSFTKKGFEIVTSLEEAISLANGEEVFITGGAQIYKMALPIANRLYITRIHTTIEGDAFFPKFEEQDWDLEWEETHKADTQNPYDYTFQRYSRKRN